YCRAITRPSVRGWAGSLAAAAIFMDGPMIPVFQDDFEVYRYFANKLKLARKRCRPCCSALILCVATGAAQVARAETIQIDSGSGSGLPGSPAGITYSSGPAGVALRSVHFAPEDFDQASNSNAPIARVVTSVWPVLALTGAGANARWVNWNANG